MSRLIKIADWSGEKRGNVVFVHGLGGHPYDTWRRAPGDDTFWPVWLAEDVKGLSVYSLGYISPPTNWLGTAMPLLDEAANVLRLLLSETDLQTGPIAFICHSLGGLIVKQVLRAANEQKSDPGIADFLVRTRQVIFIATPHTGSGKASLLERARFLAWGSDSAKALVANKPELRDLNGRHPLWSHRRPGLGGSGPGELPADADPGKPHYDRQAAPSRRSGVCRNQGSRVAPGA
jgi:pimeloyl-ACP methyl ester carboxylesterase